MPLNFREIPGLGAPVAESGNKPRLFSLQNTAGGDKPRPTQIGLIWLDCPAASVQGFLIDVAQALLAEDEPQLLQKQVGGSFDAGQV